MKKQYIIAVLLLVGLGILSTMAFSFSTLTTEEVSTVYEVNETSGMTIGKVKIKPLSVDKMKIEISSISASSNYDLTLSFGSDAGITLSSASSSVNGSLTVDDTDDYFEEVNLPLATTSVTYIVSGTDIWTDTTRVYIAINSYS